MRGVLLILGMFFIPCLNACSSSDNSGASQPVISPSGTLQPKTPNTSASSAPVGLNIAAIHDYSASVPFVDVFKASRPFLDTTPDLELDSSGWVKSLHPGQVATTYMLWDIPGSFPSGLYTVLYKGRGKLQYGGSARLINTKQGRELIRVNAADNGIELNIIETDPEDPLRNIRVIMPGGICHSDPFVRVEKADDCSSGDFVAFVDNYADQVFNPDFLNFLRPFKLLRFMDMMETNGSPVVQWQQRHKLQDATWAGPQGAPVEVMTDLVNRLGSNAWITLPHRADNNYVKQFATLLKQQLNPELKLYLEYSNEVWNGQFAQFNYALEEGIKRKLDSNKWVAGQKFYARRAIEIFDIFDSVFGGSKQLVRVLASQAANVWLAEQMLDSEDISQHVDALAIATYFGGGYGHPEKAAEMAKISVEQLLDLLSEEAVPEAIAWVKQYAALAKKYNLDLIAYEGGQHLAGVAGEQEKPALNKLFDATNRHPRMKQIYLRYYQLWRQAGGQELSFYASPGRYTKWGRWGIAETMIDDRETSPKHDAILEMIAADN